MAPLVGQPVLLSRSRLALYLRGTVVVPLQGRPRGPSATRISYANVDKPVLTRTATRTHVHAHVGRTAQGDGATSKKGSINRHNPSFRCNCTRELQNGHCFL